MKIRQRYERAKPFFRQIGKSINGVIDFMGQFGANIEANSKKRKMYRPPQFRI